MVTTISFSLIELFDWLTFKSNEDSTNTSIRFTLGSLFSIVVSIKNSILLNCASVLFSKRDAFTSDPIKGW